MIFTIFVRSPKGSDGFRLGASRNRYDLHRENPAQTGGILNLSFCSGSEVNLSCTKCNAFPFSGTEYSLILLFLYVCFCETALILLKYLLVDTLTRRLSVRIEGKPSSCADHRRRHIVWKARNLDSPFGFQEIIRSRARRFQEMQAKLGMNDAIVLVKSQIFYLWSSVNSYSYVRIHMIDSGLVLIIMVRTWRNHTLFSIGL